MSSDTSSVTVLRRVTPTWQLWRVRNTTAGGANDYVSTRSFALAALLELNKGRVLRARHTGEDVTSAFPDVGDEWLEEAWFKEHASRYISQVGFLARANRQPGDAWPELDFDRREGEGPRAYEDRLTERSHFVVLSIESKASLEWVPDVFSTTGFDWWWKDPTREPVEVFSSWADYQAGVEEYVREGLSFLARDGSI